MISGFNGFRPEAIKFLRGLKKNNNREWFQARKEIFETEVKAPLTALVAALQHEIEKEAPEYLQNPSKCLYRIYRDTRFSRDKTPYKTHASASLRRPDLGKDGSAVFYFHLSPAEVLIAVGSYAPGPEELRALRTHLVDHAAGFQKLCRSPKVRMVLGELQGEQLTRVPKGFAPDHAAADLLRRKQFYFLRQMEPALATTPQLFEELKVTLRTALPLMRFLNSPLVELRRTASPLEVR